MILVKDIEYVNVDMDRIEIPVCDFNAMNMFDKYNHEYVHPNIKTEIYESTRFFNVNGEEIALAWSDKVQKLLGLPFEVFRNQQNELDKLGYSLKNEKNTTIELSKELNKYKNMTFWQRLVFLFQGYHK